MVLETKPNWFSTNISLLGWRRANGQLAVRENGLIIDIHHIITDRDANIYGLALVVAFTGAT